ncbi:uncharacterized protein LOC106642045 [Copidosoma floridanum]|uniref:uncharacterized protein LOC106642045 n=1 Tax=Copidosoma floridanum TaxID=29053 RepID=UPI000C6F5A1D|nr:uncharacterized protein LOC106642045 [Copidosoma floridanum]
MLPKGAAPLLALVLWLAVAEAVLDNDAPIRTSSRFYAQRDQLHNSNDQEIRRSSGGTSASTRRESNFDPNVLNRFLEDYADKIRRTTEKTTIFGYDEDAKVHHQDDQDLEAIAIEINDKDVNASIPHGFREPARFNETSKRHKFYVGNDDRNTGWVTLDAVPWSKSKISKWQPNPTTQGPWPEHKPWDKPSFNKPWNSDYPSRPASYETGKPWQNKLTRPEWSDNDGSGSSKPWYSERPRPIQHERPSYPAIANDEDNPNQAQKWPPERPAWDREPSRPSLDTDDSPSNFPPNNWENYEPKPSYTHHTESYVSESGGWHDRNDFPSPNSHNGHNGKHRPSDDGYNDRPHFSHYKYPSSSRFGTSGGNYPPNHPSSGDGQWILLSTNRGYSKSRQRSIKLDALVNADTKQAFPANAKKQRFPQHTADNEEHMPAVTSKRQVRLIVLPSLNATNTTTSHGGLLEVEPSFKTVEQSRREYELEMHKKQNNATNGTADRPSGTKIQVNKRPTRNKLATGSATSSAVLAAVGAGMVPATMAMMIPMMLGKKRRRRSADYDQLAFISVPVESLLGDSPRRRRA